jgi:hypothetical protein
LIGIEIEGRHEDPAADMQVVDVNADRRRNPRIVSWLIRRTERHAHDGEAVLGQRLLQLCVELFIQRAVVGHQDGVIVHQPNHSIRMAQWVLLV